MRDEADRSATARVLAPRSMSEIAPAVSRSIGSISLQWHDAGRAPEDRACDRHGNRETEAGSRGFAA